MKRGIVTACSEHSHVESYVEGSQSSADGSLSEQLSDNLSPKRQKLEIGDTVEIKKEPEMIIPDSRSGLTGSNVIPRKMPPSHHGPQPDWKQVNSSSGENQSGEKKTDATNAVTQGCVSGGVAHNVVKNESSGDEAKFASAESSVEGPQYPVDESLSESLSENLSPMRHKLENADTVQIKTEPEMIIPDSHGLTRSNVISPFHHGDHQTDLIQENSSSGENQSGDSSSAKCPVFSNEGDVVDGRKKKKKKKYDEEPLLDWRNYAHNVVKTKSSENEAKFASGGELSPTKEKKKSEYGRPLNFASSSFNSTPMFGTTNNSVGDDVKLRLEVAGLPSSFGGKKRGLMERKRTKSSSSSSERGPIGFRSVSILAMGHPMPLMARTNRGADEDDELTHLSYEKKEDGGCCDVTPVGEWRRMKTLPQFKEEYIDSHCHLDFIHGKLESFHDMDDLRSMFPFPKYFKGCIANFIKPEMWKYPEWIKKVVKDRQVLGTSWGVHPHYAGVQNEALLQNLKIRIMSNREELKIVAIGECGVDMSEKNEIALAKQLEVFKFQVELGYELDLPIIIHCREGPGGDPEDEVLKVLQQRPNHPIHRHCFTRDSSVAKKWMKTLHNCTFGFTPLVTRSDWFIPLVKCIPLDRIHLETDAPYFRAGEYEEFARPAQCSLPGAAVTVAVRIAEINGLSVDEVIRTTRMCTNRIYRLPS